MRVVDWMPAWVGLLALIALIALAAAVYAASRRAQDGPGGGRWWTRVRALMLSAPPSALVCSASMRLTPRHSVHVVEWEGRRLLVGCGEQSICLVAESPHEGRG